jgi:ribosomal protein L12E/L44/L45/RPP1/RPP2
VLTLCLGEEDVSKLLTKVGVAVDKENLQVLIQKVGGKSIPELVALGSS